MCTLDEDHGLRAADGELLDPLSDCLDHSLWYGYGTSEASLAAGLRLGVAKNVTIHSGKCSGTPVHHVQAWRCFNESGCPTTACCLPLLLFT